MRLPLRLASIFILILLAVAWVAPTAAAPNAPSEGLSTLARRAADLANQERVAAGLNPLKWNDQLAVAAAGYAQDMAARGFFAHNTPEGVTPVDRAVHSGGAAGWTRSTCPRR